ARDEAFVAMIGERVNHHRALFVQWLPAYQQTPICRPVPWNESWRRTPRQTLRHLLTAGTTCIDDIRIDVTNLIKQLAAVRRPHRRNHFAIRFMRHLRKSGTIRPHFPDFVLTAAI